jgi:hypothetical protein
MLLVSLTLGNISLIVYGYCQPHRCFLLDVTGLFADLLLFLYVSVFVNILP